MLALLHEAKTVITDSGGLQKEAYWLHKKSLVLMPQTPWQELVDYQFVQTTEFESVAIQQAYQKLQALTPDFSITLYGDGQAAPSIAQILRATWQ